METTLTNRYEPEVLSVIGYAWEGELSEALLQSIDRGPRDLDAGRKKSNEGVQIGARILTERWKKQLENQRYLGLQKLKFNTMTYCYFVVTILSHFSTFYRILEEENEIEIVAFWDNRNDPKKLDL